MKTVGPVGGTSRNSAVPYHDVTKAPHVVLSLPLEIDRETARRVAGETAGLARQYRLTICAAAYLELAMRRGATLATSDADLAKAAKKAGVSVL